MNELDIHDALVSLGYQESVFSIGREKDNAICLVSEGDSWQVFFSERGRRYDVAKFANLGSAIDELLIRLASEPVARVDPETDDLTRKWRQLFGPSANS